MAIIKTESSWLASTTPGSLLRTLRGKRMPRQRRLIAAACCRRFFDELSDPRSREAVEAGELFADGAISKQERDRAYKEAQEATQLALHPCLGLTAPGQTAAFNAWWLTHAAQLCSATTKMDAGLSELLRRARRLGREHEQREKVEQCAIIRDVVGNPFRPAPALDPNWLTWNDRLIPRLAGTICLERRFADLPVLGDALEDAGCADEQLLSHCRSGGLHVRGCWVLDLVLGRR